jgi:hypothetical protein
MMRRSRVTRDLIAKIVIKFIVRYSHCLTVDYATILETIAKILTTPFPVKN